MEAVGGSSDDDEEEAEMQPRIRERAPSISSVFMVMLLSWLQAGLAGGGAEEGGGGPRGHEGRPQSAIIPLQFLGTRCMYEELPVSPRRLALLDHYA